MFLRRNQRDRAVGQREGRAYRRAVAAADTASFVFAQVEKVLPDPPTKRIDYFAYHDAISWFSTADPGELGINGGALLRQSSPNGWLLVQVFLKLDPDRQGFEIAQDDRGQTRGRRFIAQVLDVELDEAFADSDLIIFR